VVYKVERKFDRAYDIVGVPSLWLPSHFQPVDLDAGHDIQVGDTVRVVAGDEQGRALWTNFAGQIQHSGVLSVGDTGVVTCLWGDGTVDIRGRGSAHSAFVEKVDTDANRIHRLTLRQAELERELFDTADKLRKVHDELKALGVDVEGVDRG
jgi:hypothetical protein